MRNIPRVCFDIDGPYFPARTQRLRRLLAKVMTWLTRK